MGRVVLFPQTLCATPVFSLLIMKLSSPVAVLQSTPRGWWIEVWQDDVMLPPPTDSEDNWADNEREQNGTTHYISHLMGGCVCVWWAWKMYEHQSPSLRLLWSCKGAAGRQLNCGRVDCFFSFFFFSFFGFSVRFVPCRFSLDVEFVKRTAYLWKWYGINCAAIAKQNLKWGLVCAERCQTLVVFIVDET